MVFFEKSVVEARRFDVSLTGIGPARSWRVAEKRAYNLAATELLNPQDKGLYSRGGIRAFISCGGVRKAVIGWDFGAVRRRIQNPKMAL